MTYSLDSSALLRILVNDPKQLAANVAMFIHSRQLKGDAFAISDLVLSEVYFALQYHYGVSKDHALDILRHFANLPGFVVSSWAKDVLALPNLAKASPGFVDRLIHGAAFSQGQTTVSCEKDFRRLPSTKIIKENTPTAELVG